MTSAKGSILDIGARKHVVTLIYVRVPLFLLEIAWTVVSTITIIQYLTEGHADICYFLYGLFVTVILEWILIITILIGTVLVFNPYGAKRIERSIAVERNYWKRNLVLCKVFRDTQMRAAIDDIAALLASFFGGSDFVLSDIVAGLLLFVHSPHRKPPIEAIDDEPTVEWMRMPENFPMIKRMFDFASAVYGWPAYVCNNCGCMPWVLLCRRINWCGKCKCNQVLVVEDNCCSCHTTAFVLSAEIENTDLFFVSFRNRLYQVPFVVLTDHKTSSIIITIRGSMSLLDIVTDLMLNDAVFSVDVDTDDILRQDETLDTEGEVRVHLGMLKSARYVYNTLQKHNVLEDLFMLNPGYNLIVTGHSLGAGVASLLTLLLKQTYPTVRCYAFSPPGCVISKNGQAEMEQHVLGIIVGDDLVPRTSYQSMLRLKMALDREIYSTNLAKFEIIIKGFFKLFFTTRWELHSEEETRQNHSGLRSENMRDQRRLMDGTETFVNYGTPDQNGGESVILPAESSRVQLYPPGKLLHMTMNDDIVSTRWLKHDFFKDIQLTSSMVVDHLPVRIRKVMKKFQHNDGIINV
uniref:sn-1-specific diacylglycerol lipase n=1 Tax=Acrobeloides nanus TaxID=290746 RepID=A0A914C025_9BILA